MGRSIGAVIVGFLYAVAAIWLAQMVLWFAVPEDPGPDGNGIVPPIRWILTVVCTFPAAVIAGFIAALVARQSELAHGLAVGAILVLVLGISTLLREPEDAPAWYQLALPGVALPGTLLGAGLRLLIRRAPRLLPPPSQTEATP